MISQLVSKIFMSESVNGWTDAWPPAGVPSYKLTESLQLRMAKNVACQHSKILRKTFLLCCNAHHLFKYLFTIYVCAFLIYLPKVLEAFLLLHLFHFGRAHGASLIRQRIQEALNQTANAEVSIRQRMQDTLHQTADAEVSLSDSGCRSLSFRHWMQKSLYQTANAGVSLSDSGCRRHSIRQRTQKSLYQTADAGDTLSDSGCRSLSIRQWSQETLYQTADAGVSLSDS